MKISEDNLKDTLREALQRAHKFEWTGWGIPIYVHDDGTTEAGGWLSNSSWQPGIIELCRVETWDCEDMGYLPEEDYTLEECIDNAIELDMLDFHMTKIEDNIATAKEMAEEPYAFVDAIALAAIEIE